MSHARFFLTAVALVWIVLSGCASSARFVKIPHNLDTTAVARETVEINARRFSFDPEVIRVRRGTLVTFRVTSKDATHGFRISDFGIDEELTKGATKTIQLYAAEPGEYSIVCNVFCGLGHLGMRGKLIVEEKP